MRDLKQMVNSFVPGHEKTYEAQMFVDTAIKSSEVTERTILEKIDEAINSPDLNTGIVSALIYKSNKHKHEIDNAVKALMRAHIDKHSLAKPGDKVKLYGGGNNGQEIYLIATAFIRTVYVNSSGAIKYTFWAEKNNGEQSKKQAHISVYSKIEKIEQNG